MNGNLKDFLTGIGAMVELWTVIFKGFKAQGYEDKDALTHTKAFMETVIKTGGDLGGSNQ